MLHKLTRSAAYGTSDGGHQRGLTVSPEKFADEYTYAQGSAYYDYVYHNGWQAYLEYLLKSEAEAVKDDTQPENLLGAELNSGSPGGRQSAAQRIGIYHSQNDADNQRAEGKLLDKIETGDIECRK